MLSFKALIKCPLFGEVALLQVRWSECCRKESGVGEDGHVRGLRQVPGTATERVLGVVQARIQK